MSSHVLEGKDVALWKGFACYLFRWEIWYKLGRQIECLSSYLFKKIWKGNEGKKRDSRIAKQTIERGIHGQVKRW